MRNITTALLTIIFLTLYPGVICYASEPLLERLDHIIDHKEIYRETRQMCADSLARLALSQSGKEKINSLKQLYEVYNGFRADSALNCIRQIENDNLWDEDSDLQAFTTIARARTMAMMGLFREAFIILDSVNVKKANEENRLNFYYTKFTICGWCAEYASHATPGVTKEYNEEMFALLDSIIKMESRPDQLEMIRATKALNEHRPGDVLEICRRLIDKRSSQEVYANSCMSLAYAMIGQTDLQIHHLALTAIADIESGVTEYMALPMLAQTIYGKGDTQRAYKYLTCSIEDASFCKARLRTVEASTTFPIIDKAFRAQQTSKRLYVIMAVGVLVALMLMLVGMVWILRKQMRKLNYTRMELEKTHGELLCADRKKEEYIASYLNRCQKYIAAFDKYRRSLLSLVQSHKMEELHKQLKSDSYANTEFEHFYPDFDKAFLDLYPSFIEKFNALLKPEAMLSVKKGKTLTTELRIFALIRMGVDDSDEIAHFLNCSLTTIYNYRSRIIKNSIYDKEEFMQRLMEI